MISEPYTNYMHNNVSIGIGNALDAILNSRPLIACTSIIQNHYRLPSFFFVDVALLEMLYYHYICFKFQTKFKRDYLLVTAIDFECYCAVSIVLSVGRLANPRCFKGLIFILIYKSKQTKILASRHTTAYTH